MSANKSMMTNRRCPCPLVAKPKLGRAVHAPSLLLAAVAYWSLDGPTHMDSDVPSEDVARLRSEIATYPTDLRLRLRLGAALSACRDYSGAISELHMAMGSPHVRLSALGLLVTTCQAAGMYDLATHFREQLSRESGDESGSGSAPVPAPTRPVAPRDSSRAEKPPHEDDAV
jgi:hypothetical protein